MLSCCTYIYVINFRTIYLHTVVVVRHSNKTQHCMKNNHEFDFNNVKVIDCCFLLSRRLFLEAWHSIRKPNSINDYAHISDIYNIIN